MDGVAAAAASATWPALVIILILLVSQPLFILITCLTLRLCGVSKKEASAWALTHASKNRAIEIIRAVRGKDSRLRKLLRTEDPIDASEKPTVLDR